MKYKSITIGGGLGGLVIPCHYNCPALFTKKFNPADDQMFKSEVEKMGIKCVILQNGESVEL